MVKEAIATGATVEEAFAAACAQLGVETTEAQIEVLELPEKKVFGLFGGNPAKVRAFLSRTPADAAADYLREVLGAMNLRDVNVEIKEAEAGAELVLTGEDIGFIIGHRGETLDSLQYLASLVANHVDDSYFRVTLDVGNYREKRKETLENLGRKMAQRAVKTGRNSSLEPMNPYERRIIHTAVQEVEGAKSWSEGEDLGRHVVVGPEGGERRERRDSRPARGGYNRDNRGGSRDRGPRRDDFRPRTPRPADAAPAAPRVLDDGPVPRAERTERPAKPVEAAPKPRVLDGDISTPYGRIEKK